MEILPSQGSVGNNGGLITIWDNTTLELLDKRTGLNSITCLFHFRINGFKFLLTNAYSPCDHDRREIFWSDLADVRAWSSESWCFVGDVNAVRSDAERNTPGGDVINMKLLNDFVSDNELPLHGGAYTWRNKQNDPLLCRLDRCLVCTAFDAKFNNATQTAFVRTISDHHAILLDLSPTIKNHIRYVLFRKLQNLKKFIKNWSRSTFGNVRNEEEELKKKISVLNLAEESMVLSPAQLGERADLLNSLRNVKCTRSRMAFQRRRSKASKMEIKTRSLSIQCNRDGWKGLLKRRRFLGPDGYNLEFYKACWEVLNKDILAAVNEFHCTGKLDWRLNVSFMKMIPKKEDSTKGAFIKDRQILDGILVANDLIDSRLRQCTPGVMCKINMQEVFDNKERDQLGSNYTKNAELMAPWKRRYLNKASRVFLIRSSLESLAVYFMSLHHMPASVEKRLNTIMQKFLWGEEDGRRKMSWVSFKRVCKPKNKGGLGIRSLRLINKSLLAKWHIRYCREKTALWRRTVCEKSKADEECLLPLQVKETVGRSMWFDILRENKIFIDSVNVQVKDVLSY
ncbi:uncharacterized protein LOC113316672 [Papaver somniferum]|uniref:uncharacterized protein LOC113316672 n=1 Tax=Papaver somniferum TaxID=3469 RepID=UPI000E6F6BF4|nr:uncharacterized protein LOC113316672 [Papaver somniferum]